jgi:hypothetical protein
MRLAFGMNCAAAERWSALGLGFDPPLDFDGFARRCFGGVAYSLNSDRSASPPMRENA